MTNPGSLAMGFAGVDPRHNVGHQRGWDPPKRPPGAARGQAAPPGRPGAYGPPLAHLLDLSLSWCMDFLYFLWEFSRTPRNSYSCTQENHTGSSAENSVSPG